MTIVVSGASQGIGYEVVIQLAQKGHQVLAIARNQEKLLALSKKNPQIETLAIDLLDSNLSSRLKEIFKGRSIDAIINNAGQLINKPFMNTTMNDFQNQFNSNVLTTVNLVQSCQAFLAKGAHIVNISSMGGYQGSSKFAGLSAYSTSKGALSILTECMAEELKEEQVKVNALALGAVQTEMLEAAFPGYAAPVSPSEMASYICEFTINGRQYFNGRVLPVALGNP